MNLQDVRIKIDAIDQALVRLLNERADMVNLVGEIKHREGLDIYAPEREEKLLRKLVALNVAQQGRLPERSIRAIYREIMSAALALERQLGIAYLGPAGSRAHQVALSKFGHGVVYQSEASTAAVFARVTSGEADYGVLPIEHSAEGAVHHTLDQFACSLLQICAQVVIHSGTADGRSRYIILGRRASPATGEDHTMLMLSVQDQVGALLHLLEAFVKHSVNVRQIENRPLIADQSTGEARFFLEVNGHPSEAALAAVISELEGQGSTVKVLGSYPASAWVETLGG